MGHNRLKAFSKLGKDAKVDVLSFGYVTLRYPEKISDIINNNLNIALKDEH
jgi:hypothetical protein